VQATSDRLACKALLRLVRGGQNTCATGGGSAAGRPVPRLVVPRLVFLVAAAFFLASVSAHAGSVTLAWDPSPDPAVTGYRVFYGTAPGVYSQSVNVGNTTSHTVGSLDDTTTYYFSVRSYNANEVLSTPSNEVKRIGAFTDDPLTPGTHKMRLVHLTELRARIDAVRAARALTAMVWTPVVQGVTAVRASHIVELRTAINAAYDASAQALPVYTDVELAPGFSVIKAVHIRELRAAIVALE
jgi:hypothetical protein